MTRLRLLGTAALVGACSLVSALAIAWSSSSLAVAGSTPAIIWAPDVRRAAVICLVGLTIVFVAARVTRWVALALWLATLVLFTHRVIDGGSDGFRDVWLEIPLLTISEWAEGDDEPRSCQWMRLPAICFMRAGKPHRIMTFVPFKPLL